MLAILVVTIMTSFALARDAGVSIAAWNSRGLFSSIPCLRELMKSNDIIALSEHWLHANRLNVLNEISEEFSVVSRASRHSPASEYGQRSGQGGVALMWRNTLAGVAPLTELTHDRLCGINIHTSDGRSLNIYSVYLPASCSVDDYDVILDEVAGIVDGNDKGTLSIL